MAMMASAASAAPIPLQEWIRRARPSMSEEDYLECAVAVALELTNILCEAVDGGISNKNSDAAAKNLESDSLLSFNGACQDSSELFEDLFSSLENEEKQPGGDRSFNNSFSNSSWHDSSESMAALFSSVENEDDKNQGTDALPSFNRTGTDYFEPLLEVEDLLSSVPNEEKKAGSVNFDKIDQITSALLLLQIEDIVAENVLVSISKNATLQLMEVNVDIQTTNNDSSKPSNFFDSAPLSGRSVCFALGKILFEIFSRGDPLLLIDMDMNNDEHGDSFSKLLLGGTDLDVNADDENDFDLNPRSSKRTSQSDAESVTSLPTSTKARFFLEEKGMPLSVCQLVSDLLDAEEGNQYMSDTAILSLEEAQLDLLQMKIKPQRFLYDLTCPTKALEYTSLFSQQVDGGELYGREKEVRMLMDIAARITMQGGAAHHLSCFQREACFISGHSGSGKSSVIKRLVSFCDANNWSVLLCKFDRQVAPLSTLLQSCDEYFDKVSKQQYTNPSVRETFERIQSTITSFDDESFVQLYHLLPSFKRLFPQPAGASNGGPSASFTEGVLGSGSNRLKYLFQIIFTAMSSAGHPVAIILEDMQWVDAPTIDIIGDYIQTTAYDSAFLPTVGQSRQGGLLYLGSFRDNEVTDDGFLMNHIEYLESSQGNINVTRILVGELPVQDINNLLSFKLCLPKRRTQSLAELVYHKTRGNPMYVVEFLRSIIQNGLLAFSIKERRWTWTDSIDLQHISEGVAELLTKKLRDLPNDTLVTLKVMSCFGFSINLSTIQLLDLGQFDVQSMTKSLEAALAEGIIDKAGPVYAFSHDSLQESTYSLIREEDRKQLHKISAMSLAQNPDEVSKDADLCRLAVDQINVCKDILNPLERAKFANLNLAAGKHSMRASSYEQARGYFEAGIDLLHANNWEKQYALSLELYEMSIRASFMDGNSIDTVWSRLNEILSNTKSFDDALNAQALFAKVLVSQEKYAEGVDIILQILKDLGEVFPKKIETSYALSEIKSIMPMLSNITKEGILNLPAMSDPRKLKAMHFMDMLATFSHFLSPNLVQVLACQMIRHTYTFGYCEESISCLIYLSLGLLLYAEEMELSKRMNRIALSLMASHPNEHSLRARSIVQSCTVSLVVEPCQAGVEQIMNGYRSATIVGDVDNAMLCALMYCIAVFYCNSDLQKSQRKMIQFMHEMVKHKRNGLLHSTMTLFSACTALIGNKALGKVDMGIEIKTNDELALIAEQTQNSYLMHHVIINQMCVRCYFREYLTVTKLAENFKSQNVSKRLLETYARLYEGISAFCLARDTKQEKWRQIGEDSLEHCRQHTACNWNIENKILLLEAELYYLDNRIEMADISFQAAILSAHDHKLINEEALAEELYGTFLVETKQVGKGMKQLQSATAKYKKWGATRKAHDVEGFVKLIQQTITTKVICG